MLWWVMVRSAVVGRHIDVDRDNANVRGFAERLPKEGHADAGAETWEVLATHAKKKPRRSRRIK